MSASEASNITTTTTTFLNQAINSSDKNTEETSKKKKSMLERHLNAFAEIFADHIIEVSEDEYFATVRITMPMFETFNWQFFHSEHFL